MIEEGLYAHLSTNNDISAVVGDRIYLSRLPQEPTLPAVVYSNISGIPYMTMNAKGSLDRSRFQVDCWGSNALEAKSLAQKVRSALEGFRGQMGNEVVHAVIPIEVGMDDFDDVVDAFRIIAEYNIWHQV